MSKLTYIDKPVFGFDIGRSSIKIMQISDNKGKSFVTGYGNTAFDQRAVAKGVVRDFDAIAKTTFELFEKQFVGTLTTKRVAFSIPNEYSFSRVLTLPKLKPSELKDAVITEA